MEFLSQNPANHSFREALRQKVHDLQVRMRWGADIDIKMMELNLVKMESYHPRARLRNDIQTLMWFQWRHY